MKKYNIILADPPWTFETYSDKGKGRSPENHYDCMTLEDISNLNVSEIADEDCILFLWVTFPMLRKIFDSRLIEKWGFEYKTCAFNWFKKNKIKDSFFWGTGYYSRANTELCLLATKGKPKRVSRGVHQVVSETDDLDFEWLDTEQLVTRVEEHSKKPNIVRDKIILLCGDLPRIELFARQKVEGWDAWGLEVENDIEIKIRESSI